MTPQKSHSVGNQPTNPIVTDKWVYRISNIQREYPPEDDGLIHWSYDVDEQIPLAEYTKQNIVQTMRENLDRDEIISTLLEGGGL
jgi:hypothetical protein